MTCGSADHHPCPASLPVGRRRPAVAVSIGPLLALGGDGIHGRPYGGVAASR